MKRYYQIKAQKNDKKLDYPTPNTVLPDLDLQADQLKKKAEIEISELKPASSAKKTS